MGNYLVIGIALIFVLALASSFTRYHYLDRVLRKLRGFQVTLRLPDEQVWGKFKLYSNAIELLFNQPYINHRGLTLTSFILFKEQLGEVETIFRFHDELTPQNKQRRLDEIERVRHPGMMRRIKRALRNFTAAFRDAIAESIGLMASRVQQYTGYAVLKNADGKFKQVGNSVLDMVGNTAYDPVLENYIFHKVVFEVLEANGEKAEYTGILEEYSSNWVSLLDCYLNRENEISLMDASRLTVQRNMDFEIELEQGEQGVDFSLRIINTDAHELTLRHISGASDFSYTINKIVQPGESTELRIENLPADTLTNVDPDSLPLKLKFFAENTADGENGGPSPDLPGLPELKLVFQICRGVDIYIPRNKGILRHGGEMLG